MATALYTLINFYVKPVVRGKSFATQDEEQGFTLIELLVVIIVIGILAAIGLPTLLGQVNRAQATGAQIHVGSFNRAQQAYLLGHSSFASSLAELEVEVPPETSYHTYAVQNATANWTTVTATPKAAAIRGYVGVVYISENNIKTVICEGTTGTVPSVTLTQSGADWVLSGCDKQL